ncbi:MAG: PAS domain-containing protein [Planctomycetaceae bacterium]|nr:PAS domain-containing protein [Planctomycetaceae bacterium]
MRPEEQKPQEQQNAQQLLQEAFDAHQRLEAVLKALPVGVNFSLDPDCKHVVGNAAAQAQFEVQSQDNLSASASDTVAPGRQIRYYHDGEPVAGPDLPLQRAVAENREIEPVELEVVLPSGKRWFALVSAAPVHDQHGAVTGGVAITVDITERKRTEETLRWNDQRNALLSQTAARLLQSDDPRGLLDDLCLQVMDFLDCQVFFNFLADEESGRLHLNTCAGIDADEARRIEWLDYGVAVCGCVARDRQRVIAENIAAGADPRTDLVRSYGIEAYCCHPLLVHDTLIGTLSFGTARRPRFSVEEIGVMESVANLVADAMHRIETQSLLRQREEQLRLFVQHAPAAIAMFDTQMRYVAASQRWVADYGLAGQDLHGRSHYEVLPEIPQRWKQIHQRCLQGAVERAEEDPFPRTDGSVQWIRWEIHPWHLSCGAVGGIVMFTEDITQARNAQEEIRKAEELNRQTLQALPAHIAVIDTRGDIIAVNQAWMEFADANDASNSPAVAVGANYCAVCRRAIDTTSPEAGDAAKALAGIEAVLNGRQEQFTLEYPCHSPSQQRWFMMTVVPLGAAGKTGAVITHLNITSQKQAEGVLRQSKEELERRVQERTRELHLRSQQLARLASELALTEQRERGRLAQVLHDGLQQLLAGAKFRLAVLERSLDPVTRATASNVNELLNDSIETSRSLTAELSPPILHQGGLIAAMEWLARWMQEKHALTVELDVQGAAPEMEEDIKVLLFQATRELLFNVAKHAAVKSATVRVSRMQGFVQIVVSDEGAGFEPGSLPVGAAPAGFGLFSISERLGLLGGRMEIDSAPGRGCRITLEAATAIEPQSQLPPERAGQGSATIPHPCQDAQDKIRVVLVDDHIVLRQGLVLLLKEEPDLEIVGEASDGHAAIEIVRQLRPDVVLMDISMPGMNGIEATRVLHAELPHIQIIGLSMFDQAEQAQAMRDAGAAEYLTKSGASDVLVATIRRCAKQATGQQ